MLRTYSVAGAKYHLIHYQAFFDLCAILSTTNSLKYFFDAKFFLGTL
jgi:hypothetical protein